MNKPRHAWPPLFVGYSQSVSLSVCLSVSQSVCMQSVYSEFAHLAAITLNPQNNPPPPPEGLQFSALIITVNLKKMYRITHPVHQHVRLLSPYPQVGQQEVRAL